MMKSAPYIQQGVLMWDVVEAHCLISKLRDGCIIVLEAAESFQESEKVLTK